MAQYPLAHRRKPEHELGCYGEPLVRWPAHFPAPPQLTPDAGRQEIISLLDLTATTLAIAGVPRSPLMQSRAFLGPDADALRQYAFSARDRIDETVQRIRGGRDARYRYTRTFTDGPTFASLNRYKEKCFPVMPLMRRLFAEGKLSGPPAALMSQRGPCEELYDVENDPHEIANLANSPDAEYRAALARLRAALEVWIAETGDRGAHPEPPAVVAPFAKEMDEWFGTPAWAR